MAGQFRKHFFEENAHCRFFNARHLVHRTRRDNRAVAGAEVRARRLTSHLLRISMSLPIASVIFSFFRCPTL